MPGSLSAPCKHASTSEWWSGTSSSIHVRVQPGHHTPRLLTRGFAFVVHGERSVFQKPNQASSIGAAFPDLRSMKCKREGGGKVKVVCHVSMARSHDWHCCSDSFHVQIMHALLRVCVSVVSNRNLTAPLRQSIAFTEAHAAVMHILSPTAIEPDEGLSASLGDPSSKAYVLRILYQPFHNRLEEWELIDATFYLEFRTNWTSGIENTVPLTDQSLADT